jgi:hypothetical protein
VVEGDIQELTEEGGSTLLSQSETDCTARQSMHSKSRKVLKNSGATLQDIVKVTSEPA